MSNIRGEVMSENLSIYNQVRSVPENALKKIEAGRLKGKSDINPMWRIKTLTEQFGMCGVGWKYVIKEERLENGGKDEIAAFVNIDLFVKVNNEWSEAIPGTGGSMFVASESKGLYTSDECFKMALTDALSVACKALGFGADVYWNADKSKYDKSNGSETIEETQKKLWSMLLEMNANDNAKAIKSLEEYSSFTGKDGKVVKGFRKFDGISEARVRATYGKIKAEYEKLKQPA